MASITDPATVDDPDEIAYRRGRQVARRRQSWSIVLGAVLVAGYFGWRVGSHLVAAWWLEANQYVVLWGIDRDNWTRGGVTTVRYSSRHVMLASERPVPELRFLGDLHRLEELDLSALGDVLDDDIASLEGLPELRLLNLDRSHQPSWRKGDWPGLTDATLSRIGRLANLRELHLGAQKITDDGLKHLSGLDGLRTLDLVETAITDAGLEHLKALRSLTSVDLSRTNITAQGLAAFEASRPGLKVVADPPPTAPKAPTVPNSKANR